MRQEVPNTVPVVNENKALTKAHLMGYTIGNECDEPLDLEDVSRFKEQARWINNYSQTLKALAGSNYESQHVILVDEPADIPATGNVVRCEEFYDTLVDEFDNGMIEASQELTGTNE